MSMLKKLAGQTAVYGLSSIVGRFLNYLLVPMYTRLFVGEAGRAEYGVSSWFYAVAAFAAVIYMYGMETAFFRFSKKDDTATTERVFSTAVWSLIGSSAVFSGLLILFATPLANWTNNAGRESYFVLFAIVFAADALSTIPFALLRQRNEAMRFAQLRILSIGVNIGLNVLFYLILPFFNSKGIFEPLNTEGGIPSIRWMFVALVASSLVVLPFFRKEFQMLRAGFDAALWRTMFRYANPLIIMGLAGMINETLDRVLLKSLIADQRFAEEQIGIYSANYKLSIIITLFIQAFRFAAEPFFFAQAQGDNSRRVYAQVLKYFMIVCATIFVGVMLFLPIFKHFIGKSYWSGLSVVPILLLANLFLGAYYNLSIWYKLTDKTRLGALVSIGGAAITLILNYLWIPTMGYVGSAWATLICYFSMAGASYVLGQHYFPVPYPLRRIVSYLALALSVYLISEMLRDALDLTPSVFLLVNTFLFVIYAFVLFKMEETELRAFLKKTN